eukprot:4698787-Pyramimonas_sp.AAC.1
MGHYPPKSSRESGQPALVKLSSVSTPLLIPIKTRLKKSTQFSSEAFDYRTILGLHPNLNQRGWPNL